MAHCGHVWVGSRTLIRKAAEIVRQPDREPPASAAVNGRATRRDSGSAAAAKD
jgi:hypothetical protein